jgi:uncharacterized membrane protein YkvA (DUF1232 family)
LIGFVLKRQLNKLVQAVTGWARHVKRDGLTLWFAVKHSRTPWYAKTLGVLVVAYAWSPIDLIPDFIPVLGYLDDLILLPLLIKLAVCLLPADVLQASRAQADQWMASKGQKPSSPIGIWLVLVVWLGLTALAYTLFF